MNDIELGHTQKGEKIGKLSYFVSQYCVIISSVAMYLRLLDGWIYRFADQP